MDNALTELAPAGHSMKYRSASDAGPAGSRACTTEAGPPIRQTSETTVPSARWVEASAQPRQSAAHAGGAAKTPRRQPQQQLPQQPRA